MNRIELALSHLTEEWECVVVLVSRYDTESGTTFAERYTSGNSFAVQKMLEDEVDVNMFGDFEEEDDGEEEETEDSFG